MKKFIIIIVWGLCFCTLHAKPAQKDAVTYKFNGGRFGDNLSNYFHAKWISYRYGVELLYKPFPYSEKLAMHKLEKRHSAKIANSFSKKLFLGHGLKAPQKSSEAILYLVPYFPDSEFERKRAGFPSFPIDFEDPGFRKEIKKAVSPLIRIPKIKIPSRKISVAVHIRRGGGFPQDNQAEHRSFPLKFPQDNFYIQEIRWLAHFFRGKPLYVHLFSDDQDMLQLKRIYTEALKGLPIEFGCRTEENHHTANVLEDFFALMQFDCCIHSESNFSVCAGRVCDYMVEIQPQTFHWEGDTLMIDSCLRKVRRKKIPAKFQHALRARRGEIRSL